MNVPTHAANTIPPITLNAIVRLLGNKHATAMRAGNNAVLPITKQVSGGVWSRSISAEKTNRTTAKIRQSQPTRNGKTLREVLNSTTPKVRRTTGFRLDSVESKPEYINLPDSVVAPTLSNVPCPKTRNAIVYYQPDDRTYKSSTIEYIPNLPNQGRCGRRPTLDKTARLDRNTTRHPSLTKQKPTYLTISLAMFSKIAQRASGGTPQAARQSMR
ncbi:hypothetical protein VN12_16260 [Pirellula sp. SH-Sr6A]|nr:hypothetical protein VN12_16260 [Pirellula sp. SH-Sr6A]